MDPPKLTPDWFPNEEPPSKEPTSLFTRWLVGPGHLGGNIGLIVAGVVALGYCRMSEPNWDSDLVYRILFGPCVGYFGGCVSSLFGRDEWLRPEWATSRPFVGLTTGVLTGGGLGLTFCDGWILLMGALGGALGGLLDTIIHRDTLEDLY